MKSSCTTNALSDLVVPAKDEEKSALFGAQKTRPTTIEMAKTTVAEDNGVVRRDHSRAVRARSLLPFHCRPPKMADRREDSTEPLLAYGNNQTGNAGSGDYDKVGGATLSPKTSRAAAAWASSFGSAMTTVFPRRRASS